MQFSESWLSEFVDHRMRIEDLSHALTMAGLEVEEVTSAAPPFSGVVVGEIVSLSRHPNTDRLNVCMVDAGDGQLLQVVCGAPNARAGLKAPLARVGAHLPGLEIKASKLRGVESAGMLCSAAELGVSQDGSGLLQLESDAAVGTDFRAHWRLDDSLLTLKLTPNRGDCLSMLGLAREMSALSGAPLKSPEVCEVPASITDARGVTLINPEGCPLYCGRVVRGIDPKAQSPRWLVSRLERSGLRAISPVVDATNYVMLELGQPLHAFDLAKLRGDIHVRFGRAGEQLTVLNGQEVQITDDLLVIADEAGPVALAGVMGGLDSGVSEGTTDLFLEGAFFRPEVIAGRSRRLGFNSDAAHRFERGVDFGGTQRALERLTQIVLDTCGGQAGPVTVARAELPTRPAVTVRHSRVQKVLGVPLTPADVTGVLSRLGLVWHEANGSYVVTPPTHRFDLRIEEDIIEEIGRIHGYDRIPAALPRCEPVVEAASETSASDAQLRRLIVARGYQEVISFSFVPREWERDFAGTTQPVTLANPIASHLEVMRSQLFGSLVECLRQNLNRKRERVRVFELGRTYESRGEGFHQPVRLAGLAYGAATPEQWGAADRWIDFFDVKGDLAVLLAGQDTQFARCDHPALHPGKCAAITRQGERIGVLGELHPRWVQKYDLPKAPVLFELEMDALRQRVLPRFEQYSRFPVVTRDMAVVLAETVAAGEVLSHLKAHRPELVNDIILFDLYRGKGIDPGEKSLAFRILLQDTEKTLTDADVDSAVSKLLEHVRNKFNGRLRD